jgi:membrane protein YdbS with pleckstrin-like domain
VIKRGVIFRKNIIVPIKRIQHIEKFQGPIQMLYKLSTIIIYTAGSKAGIIGVPQENTDQIISEIKSGLQNYLDSDEVIEDEA